MTTNETKPVLIVGAGPTGMTAAMELARFGIPVRLVEKKPEPETTSRAVGVQARTLELLEQRGLVDEMLRLGNKSTAGSIYGGGKRVFRLAFDHIDSRYPFLLFISQAETERILREQLAREGVTIERRVEMIALAQAESHGGHEGVTATLRHPDGSLEEFEASYLISAEGAHSTVRSSLALKFKGKSRPEDYALGDFHIDGDLPASDFHIFSSEHGFMGLFPMGDGRFRMIASNPLSKPSKDTEPALDELQRMYDMRSHIPAKLHDLTWSSWFRINSRMVDQLQHGRLFLAGDSAHIHSPAGAQGMNTGIQDMVNLGWKLAMVLQGIASPKLLETYGADRLPVIRNVLAKTEGLTEVIGTDNPVVRAIFDHVAPLVVGTDFVQKKSTTQMSQIGLHYRDSFLSETHGHHGDLRAGDRVPDMTLRVMNKENSPEPDPREVRLFSLFDGTKFTFLYVNIDNPEELHAQFQPKLDSWHGFLKPYQIARSAGDTAEAKHFTETFGGSPALVLVRPDSYVGFMCGTGALEKLPAWLQKWFPSPGKDTAAGSGEHPLKGHPGDYDSKP